MRSRLRFRFGEHWIDGFLNRQQLIHIRPINAIAGSPGEWRAEDTMAVENEPEQPLSQTLKVEKNQRICRIDHDPAVAKTDSVVGDIPGSEVGAEVLNRLHARRKTRKRIEISLIGIAIAV